MSQNKVYLSIGRHGRYGFGNTAILREDMLSSYAMGQMLNQTFPPCTCVYHSSLERAIITARFQALGLNCTHLLENECLNENIPKFEVQKFFNRLLKYTDDNVQYYHFVTHLPVIEKLGLPFLAAGDVCLLTSDNWRDMLAENYTVQIINAQPANIELWQKIKQTPTTLDKLSAAEIYTLLRKL